MTLADVLSEAAAAIGADAPTHDTVDGATMWSVGDRPFAIAQVDGSASFLLDLDIAAAAARTPGVTASARGPGWVELRVQDVDPHTVDRAAAWFAAARRRALRPA